MIHIFGPYKTSSISLIFSVSLFLILPSSFSIGAESGHDENEKHQEEGYIKLTPAEIEEFGIKVNKATSGTIKKTVTLPGEVVIDPGRLAHIVPRVSGVARDVYKQIGDTVQSGELLATLSSRELAEIRAELQAARSRYQLAQATFERESKLKKEGITSEQEFLTAQQARASTLVELNLARQKLEAIGITDTNIKTCVENCDPTIFEIRSPSDGIVIEKHIVPGELLDNNDRPFVIANLDQVWINTTVYEEYLDIVKAGQTVTITSSISDKTIVESKIDYVSPIVSEATRSATARIIVNNINRSLSSGLFVNCVITVSESPVKIVVPKSALQTIEDKTVVFVKSGDSFEPRDVKIGLSNSQHAEVINGLNDGEEYVAENAFILKAEMQKSAFGDAHGH